MTLSDGTQQRMSDIVRYTLKGRGSACERAGVTFYEWFWGQTLEPVDRECWEWARSRWPAGYGQVYVPGANEGDYAHRIAWQLTRGPIPDGLLVLHRCDNPPCVRPSHLFVGTYSDNVQDMISKGRHPNMGRKTCRLGHTLVTYGGRRQCRECVLRRNRDWYRRTAAVTHA